MKPHTYSCGSIAHTKALINVAQVLLNGPRRDPQPMTYRHGRETFCSKFQHRYLPRRQDKLGNGFDGAWARRSDPTVQRHHLMPVQRRYDPLCQGRNPQGLVVEWLVVAACAED